MTRTFGIEIEAFGNSTANVAAKLIAAGIECRVMHYNHNITPYWKIVSDGSVRNDRGDSRNCYELVSPILQGEEGLRQVRVVMQVLQRLGAKVNRSCGMHVHLGAADLDAKAMKRIAKSFVVFESFFDGLMPEHRREDNGRYVLSNLKATSQKGSMYSSDFVRGGHDQAAVITSVGNLDTCTTIRDVIKTASPHRSMKLNMTAYDRHQTIEFRQHHGMICPVGSVEWIKMLLAFVEGAAKTRDIKPYVKPPTPEARAANFYKRFAITPAAQAYFEARRVRYQQAA